MTVRQIEHSARDPDAAEGILSGAHAGAHSAVADADGEDFHLRVRVVRTDQVGVNQVSSSLTIAGDIATAGLFVVTAATRGVVTLRAGRAEVDVPRGTAAVCPRGELGAVLADAAIDVLHIPSNALGRVAWQRFGIEPAAFRFDEMQAVGGEDAGRWAALSAHVLSELAKPDSILEQPLVQAAFVELIAATALDLFPNNAAQVDYRRGPGTTTAAVVRRAIEYIESEAQRPLTLADIAEAAGTSPDALSTAFRNLFDVTPMMFLTRVRLEYAHHALAATDPTSEITVADVAWTFGFPHPSRFVAAYRRVYGVHPARTLES